MQVIREFTSVKKEHASLWWPGLSKQIEDMGTTCPTCCKHGQGQAEPLIGSPLLQGHIHVYIYTYIHIIYA